MPTFDQNQLMESTNGSWNSDVCNPITGFSIDSRSLKKGDMFVALKTAKQDGHDYLKQAAEKGASTALVEQFIPSLNLPQLKVENTKLALQSIATQHRLSFKGTVIGITGSCGKTSTKDLLYSILGEEQTCKTDKNLNNELGVPLSLLNIDLAKHKFAVIEAGINQPGEMEILSNMIQADYAIITNIGTSHLEKLESEKVVAAEKSKLFLCSRNNPTLIINEESLRFENFRKNTGKAIILCSTDNENRVKQTTNDKMSLCDIKTEASSSEGLQLGIQLEPSLGYSLSLPLISDGMIQNFSQAIVCALKLDIDLIQIQLAINAWKPSENRNEIIQTNNSTFVVDCYNANPLSMKDSLDYFQRSTLDETPRLYVLGSMAELGKEAPQLHKQLGESIILRDNDLCVLIGEHSSSIKQGMLQNDNNDVSIIEFKTTEEAISVIEHFKGSILLKGSRKYALEQLIPQQANISEVENKWGVAC